MKMPENISPEIAAYIRALQTENSNLQNKNSELQNEVSDLKTKVEKQELQISNLTEMLVNSRKKIFGKSSEKSKFFDDAQLTLFNEAETIADPSAPEPEKETFIAAHKRRKKRTKAEITENLQHIKQVCDMEKAECEICGGELTCIGEEFVRSELNIIPAQMYVVDIYRKVYKCKNCSDDEHTNIFKAAASEKRFIAYIFYTVREIYMFYKFAPLKCFFFYAFYSVTYHNILFSLWTE